MNNLTTLVDQLAHALRENHARAIGGGGTHLWDGCPDCELLLRAELATQVARKEEGSNDLPRR